MTTTKHPDGGEPKQSMNCNECGRMFRDFSPEGEPHCQCGEKAVRAMKDEMMGRTPTNESPAPQADEFKRIPIPKTNKEWLDDEAIEKVRAAAFALNPAEQYRLAFFIAENVGYTLQLELDHPDCPHAPEPVAFMFWNEPDTQRHFSQIRETIGNHWTKIAPLYTALPVDAGVPPAPQPPVEGLREEIRLQELRYRMFCQLRADTNHEELRTTWDAIEKLLDAAALASPSLTAGAVKSSDSMASRTGAEHGMPWLTEDEFP